MVQPGAAAEAPIVIDGSSDDDAPPPTAAPPPAAVPPVAAPPAGAPRFQLEERRGDLFSVGQSVSLAHCVARDLRLGKARRAAALRWLRRAR